MKDCRLGELIMIVISIISEVPTIIFVVIIITTIMPLSQGSLHMDVSNSADLPENHDHVGC